MIEGDLSCDCLFSKDSASKQRKRWVDGTLLIKAGVCMIRDEDGKPVANSKLSSALTEAISCGSDFRISGLTVQFLNADENLKGQQSVYTGNERKTEILPRTSQNPNQTSKTLTHLHLDSCRKFAEKSSDFSIKTKSVSPKSKVNGSLTKLHVSTKNVPSSGEINLKRPFRLLRKSHIEYSTYNPKNISSEPPVETVSKRLLFGKLSEMNAKSKIFQRLETISTNFKSISDYRLKFLNAMHEELQLQVVNNVSKIYWKFRQGCRGRVINSHVQIQSLLQKEGVRFYGGVALIRAGNESSYKSTPQERLREQHRKFKLGAKEKRLRLSNNCSDEEVEEDEQSFCEVSNKEVRLFLKFSIPQGGFKTGSHSKGDIWAVCPGGGFQEEQVHFFQSIWHGISSEGLLTVKELPGGVLLKKLPKFKNLPCEAILCFNAQTELNCMDMLKQPNLDEIIPPGLLNGTVDIEKVLCTDKDKCFFLGITREEINAVVSKVIFQFNLNKEQGQVLLCCSRWFQAVNEQKASIPCNPIVLVHGAFGSGKSTTLCALCFMVNDLVIEGNKDVRIEELGQIGPKILLAAATNVAVDCVLEKLIKEGFQSIARIGSIKRISKEVLPYVIQRGDVNISKPASKAMPTYIGNKNNEDLVLEQNARVTGITCASAGTKWDPERTSNCSDAGIGGPFSIVILDECSQQIEPVSLLALAAAQSRRAVLVGDPLQLPPQLSHFTPGQPNTTCSGPKKDGSGLERTLFMRLACCGISPILLSRQYRCHPMLSALSNALFYDGRLTDGISEAERKPIFEGLKPLSFINVTNGIELQVPGNSIQNEAEATAVVRLLLKLIHQNISPLNIGVICLYRAQCIEIRRKISTLDATADNLKLIDEVIISTVDAFQGAERDIIIVTCCRTKSLGFSESPQRLNVALTRARRHLVIVGKVSFLSESRLWRHVFTSGVPLML